MAMLWLLVFLCVYHITLTLHLLRKSQYKIVMLTRKSHLDACRGMLFNIVYKHTSSTSGNLEQKVNRDSSAKVLGAVCWHNEKREG